MREDFSRALQELLLSFIASVSLGILLCLVTVSLGSCGAGGGASAALPPPPPPVDPPPAEARWFGYYGDAPAQLEETRQHVSMAWISGWLDPAGRPLDVVIVERAALACAAGKPVMLMLPGVYDGRRFNPASIPLARGILSALGPAGRACVYGLYPVDEPDLQGLGPPEIATANAALRALLAEFPELGARVRLAVIYAGANDFPGLPYYDLVSFDDYNAGEGVLEGPLAALLSVLQPHQRAFLTIGGADPWRAPPGPFVARLLADPRLVGMVVFIHIDNAARGVGLGVRSNGMQPAYCAAAVSISGGSCP